MTIGIIGAGALGTSLARALGAAGVPTIISNSRGPETLSELVRGLGPSVAAGTTEKAAQADIVVLAVRWVDVERVLSSLPAWNNRIVIDATNPVEFLDPDSTDAKDPSNPLAVYGIKAADLGGRQSSELLREHVRGARLVKAFNHLNADVLTPRTSSGARTVLFLSGDEADAKAEVRALIEQAGFFAVDLGALDVGGPLASLFGPLATTTFATA